MRLPVRHQLPRVLAALGLVAVLALPAAAPVAAADPVVLRVGTVQSLDSINPYLTEYFIGYEIFALNYDLLVDYGPNMRAGPRVRRVVDPGRQHLDVQDPARHEVVGRPAGDVRGRPLAHPDAPRRPEEGRLRRVPATWTRT